jgi:hypothetical protein
MLFLDFALLSGRFMVQPLAILAGTLFIDPACVLGH